MFKIEQWSGLPVLVVTLDVVSVVQGGRGGSSLGKVDDLSVQGSQVHVQHVLSHAVQAFARLLWARQGRAGKAQEAVLATSNVIRGTR